MRLLVCLIALSLLFPSVLTASPADLEARRKALNDLLHEQWEYSLRTSPIYASILGDKRYNDQLDDFSQQAIDDSLVQAQRFLTRFEAIDTACKAGNVQVLGKEKLGGGYVAVIIQGDLAAVTAAVGMPVAETTVLPSTA